MLEMFLKDPETQSIIMIGEIGGSAEEDAAQFVRDEAKGRPLQADGRLHRRAYGAEGAHHGPCRPRSFRGGKGGAEDKIAAMEAAGITVSPSPAQLGKTLVEKLKG